MEQPRRHPCLKALLGDLSALLAMAAAAVCCGLAVNAFRETPLPLVYVSKAERVRQAAGRIAETSGEAADVSKVQPDSGTTDTPYARPIDLASFRALQKRALILDARPEIFHRLGHIPKAISLPREDFEACYRKHRTLLAKPYRPPDVAVGGRGCFCIRRFPEVGRPAGFFRQHRLIRHSA
ncbi:MAG TPA: hypothetical protein P5026_10595 [Kiritimatiellia bacterium]|nr:hypothetical protein [Kiritimatiellia bacterium]